MKYHPYLKKADIPADLVTASGSGLDPNISEQAALIQIKRVAAARGIGDRVVAELVVKNTEGPLLGMFGPSSVNVLKLNLALDELKK
ncbi:Potassium-transporting ATPase C chain [compost metagenome]